MAERVIRIGRDRGAALGDGGQPALGIVAVGEGAVDRSDCRCRHRSASPPHRGVLVEAVGCVGDRCRGRRRVRPPGIVGRGAADAAIGRVVRIGKAALARRRRGLRRRRAEREPEWPVRLVIGHGHGAERAGGRGGGGHRRAGVARRGQPARQIIRIGDGRLGRRRLGRETLEGVVGERDGRPGAGLRASAHCRRRRSSAPRCCCRGRSWLPGGRTRHRRDIKARCHAFPSDTCDSYGFRALLTKNTPNFVMANPITTSKKPNIIDQLGYPNPILKMISTIIKINISKDISSINSDAIRME